MQRVGCGLKNSWHRLSLGVSRCAKMSTVLRSFQLQAVSIRISRIFWTRCWAISNTRLANRQAAPHSDSLGPAIYHDGGGCFETRISQTMRSILARARKIFVVTASSSKVIGRNLSTLRGQALGLCRVPPPAHGHS